MGLSNQGNIHELMGQGPGLACQESVGRIFGLVWNQTDLFLWSNPSLLAGYPDPFLTLPMRHNSVRIGAH